MAKSGLTKRNARGVLRSAARTNGWSLCVGAGVSRPVFPDWNGLVLRLVERDAGPLAADVAPLQDSYAPDAFIQAAIECLRMSEEDFAELLTGELYSDLKSRLTKKDWEHVCRVLDTRHIGRLKLRQWLDFLKIFETYYPGLTAIALATTLADVLHTPLAPRSILTFNAEPLLAALINAYVARDRSKSGIHDVIDYVTHATSDRKAERVPYVFCHGLLPVPGVSGRGSLSSVDKLVFSEASYLQLANNSFSWQSTSFLASAANHAIVFVGVSLADPNVRRWLSWTHSTRVAELTEAGAPAPTSTVHYWITKAPGSRVARRWTEALVAHLGVRVVWVTDYTEVGSILRTMLGLAITDEDADGAGATAFGV